ncbi:Na/Pi cotransporter family protein [Parapusillimonas granuli]|uniref:Na/Pi cotransporter family protein n=1 Tax=Parapusillimonas granuli TaxID=380911 RepID=A0A853G2T1_9BURK|nr:Na/Pi cotransporter family protein [Parapusillimonas granuli]MBB5216849.1 phosphate:Na+ symporter [Parapusillimonas granuli]MEB2401495.1 Na/Pi cotransporter family protein [Alcaligenaceae bacterium]NYT51648.1 Na/Pi cotransporter family protein [Parapusillimonas granuli]
MSDIVGLLNFGGFVALLIWGVHMVQSGVQRAFGAALRTWMGRALSTRARAFFAGLAITSAVQSSTATGLMITSFAASGLLSLVPGLAAMLGANVGTTIIVQLLSFNLTALAPSLILIGVWLFRRYEPGRKRDLGRLFIGLGLLLLALHELVLMFAPLQDAHLLEIALEALSGQPVIALLLAAALAWAAHSSLAVVVLIMSLAHHQLISAQLACALVLGANLGTAINPMLEAGAGDDPAGKRLPLGNLGTRIAGCLLALPALPWLPDLMDALSDDPSRAVANFHTLFNVAVAMIFLPLLTPYSKLLIRLLPKRADPDDPSRPQYLDESAHEVPAIALGNAAREALRIADMAQNLLGIARAGFLRDSRHRVAHARYVNNAVSRLENHITAYLATLDPETMNQDDNRRREEILSFSSNMAHAAGVATQGLLGHAATMSKKGWMFTPQQRDNLIQVMDRLIRNHRQSAALFVAEDLRSARYLAFEKDHFREVEANATEQHLQSLKSGDLERAQQGSLYLDILREAKTLNSCLVEAAAYPILAKHNELLPNRLRESDQPAE